MKQQEIKDLLHNCFILAVLESRKSQGQNLPDFEWDETERKVIDFVLAEHKKAKARKANLTTAKK